MQANLNKLIECYINSNIELDGVYQLYISQGSRVSNKRTFKGVCGIVIPIRGSAYFKVDQKEYIVEPGKILFAGSDLPLDKKVLGNKDWEYYLIHYKLLDQQILNHPLTKGHFCLYIGEHSIVEIHQRVQELIINERKGTYLCNLKNRGLLIDLIANLFEHTSWQGYFSEKELVEKSIQYIHENYYKELSVGDLAMKASIDGKKFYYIFNKSVGVSPKKYITAYRMNKAKEILLKEEYTIVEIAKLVGYEDEFNFSRIFKKYNGISPTHFKEQFGKNL